MKVKNIIRTSLWLGAGIFILATWTGTVWAQNTNPKRVKMEAWREEPGAIGAGLARTSAATDRAIGRVDVSKLDHRTWNFGDMGTRTGGFAVCSYPRPDGSGNTSWGWNQSMALAVGPGSWLSTPQVHESGGDFQGWSLADWEAMDGARGAQFSGAKTWTGVPMMATSDLTDTWPGGGWPAPEMATDVWLGTDTWLKWERRADKEIYCEFDDRANYPTPRNPYSTFLDITVRKRVLGYGSLDAVFFQFELTNNSADTYTECFVGQFGDMGSPTYGSWTGYPVYDAAHQMTYNVGASYNAAAGSHKDGSGNTTAWFGFMMLESPTGSFKTDAAGDTVDTPSKTMQRLSLTHWEDATYGEDQELYGALTAYTEWLSVGQSISFWKTGADKLNPVYLQDTDDWLTLYDPSNPDHYIYRASGEFDFDPGESVNYVVAHIAAGSEGALLASADKVLEFYRAKFKAPGPPPAPELICSGLLAGPHGAEYNSDIHVYRMYYTDPGSVTLSWDGSASELALDPVSLNIEFEGYKIYKSTNQGLTWGEPVTDGQGSQVGFVPAAQFDLDNDIEGDHPVDGFWLGENSGIVHSWTDTDVLDGFEYWYAITAYDYAPPEPAYESAIGGDPTTPNVIAVITGARPAGYMDGMLGTGATAGATIELCVPDSINYETSISAVILDQSVITGDSYSVTVSGSGQYGGTTYDYLGGLQVRNTTDAADLLEAVTIPQSGTFGDDLIPVTEGFRVITVQPHGGDGGVYALRQTADVDTSTGYTLYFYQSYMEGSGSSANRANTTGFMNKIEYRFTGYVTAGGDTNWGLATSTRGPLMTPYEVWDVDTNTRLYPCFYEFYGADRWYADDYNVVLPVPYYEADGVTVTDITAVHPSSDSEYWGYNPSNPNSRADWAYRWAFSEWDAPAFEDDPALNPYWDIGDVWTLTPYKVLKGYAGNSYTFSTTAPAFEDTLIDYDDIKVVPNPYYILAEWDRNVNRRKIMFTHVPPNSTIDIYTLSGELVASLDHTGSALDAVGTRGYNSDRVGTVVWNIWTYEYTEAAYGLYIYVVREGDDVKKVGKFAIIR